MKRLLFAAGIFYGFSACSLGSAFSTEGIVGTAIGTLGGTAAGYAIGDQIGKKTENMALAGAIGGGMGMLAGGNMHDRAQAHQEVKQAIVREAQIVDSNQLEIDSLRERMHENSSWGQSERRPWNERYWGESYDLPYEGTLR